MSFIDMETYKKACSTAQELVEPITLREAIFQVYEMWFKAKDEGKKIVFHSYFGLSLLDLGIDQLFEAEQYRKALAAYFQPRALSKLVSLREQQKAPVQVSQNSVEFADLMRVRIRINKAVSLEFGTTRRTGPLNWKQVEEKFKIIHFGDGQVSDEDRRHARKQALQVLNSVRLRERSQKSVVV